MQQDHSNSRHSDHRFALTVEYLGSQIIIFQHARTGTFAIASIDQFLAQREAGAHTIINGVAGVIVGASKYKLLEALEDPEALDLRWHEGCDTFCRDMAEGTDWRIVTEVFPTAPAQLIAEALRRL